MAVVSHPAHGLIEVLQGNAAPSCVVRPEQTEGPYFVDERLNRVDLRSDPTTGKLSDGALLELAIAVVTVTNRGCVPLQGAQVDIWHCDAAGVYSDVQDPGFNTVGQKFLRGYQVTDHRGTVRFNTIYPGWYPDRTVHIHFKIRMSAGSARDHEFTSQLYFNDEFTDRVFSRAPYSARGQRKRRNTQDDIFGGGGEQLVLAVKEKGTGYAADFGLGVHLA